MLSKPVCWTVVVIGLALLGMTGMAAAANYHEGRIIGLVLMVVCGGVQTAIIAFNVHLLRK